MVEGGEKKRILLVDDSRTILMQEQMLLSRTYDVVTAMNGRDGVAKAKEIRPDLVLMDVVMPEMDGLEACRALREDAETRDIPVILVTTRGEASQRDAGFESGCTDYLTKPIRPVELLERIGEVLDSAPTPRDRSAEASRARALRAYQILDSRPEAAFDDLARLASGACTMPLAAVSFLDRERVWIKAAVGFDGGVALPRPGSLCARVVEAADVVRVGDVSLETRLRDHPLVREQGIRFHAGVPVVPPGAPAIGSLCVFDRSPRGLGVAQESMLLALARQVVAQLELRRLSIRDTLTGVFNRAYLEETLEREVRRAERNTVPLGLIALDVDGFKALNERFGYAVGDHVLTEIGAVLQAKTRADDVVCRYEADQFRVILPGASLENTRRRAEHLKNAIRELTIEVEGHSVGSVTVTMAVVAYPDHGGDPQALGRLLRTAIEPAKSQAAAVPAPR